MVLVKKEVQYMLPLHYETSSQDTLYAENKNTTYKNVTSLQSADLMTVKAFSSHKFNI